jgi:hypothetical protein
MKQKKKMVNAQASISMLQNILEACMVTSQISCLIISI